MNIIQRLSPNRTRGRGGWVPDIIVNHITEGAFPGSINWVVDPVSQVSYHYMVSRAGQVTQCVDIRDTAWANGTTGSANDSRGNRHSTLDIIRKRAANANSFTISIGFEGRLSEMGGALTPAQFETALELYAHIHNEIKRIWGLFMPLTREHIIGHYQVTPRTKPNCPGPRFPFDELTSKLFANLTSNSIQEENMNMKRYQTITEIKKDHPWAVSELQTLIKKGVLKGNEGGGVGLDLTIDMIRMLIASARMIVK